MQTQKNCFLLNFASNLLHFFVFSALSTKNAGRNIQQIWFQNRGTPVYLNLDFKFGEILCMKLFFTKSRKRLRDEIAPNAIVVLLHKIVESQCSLG